MLKTNINKYLFLAALIGSNAAAALNPCGAPTCLPHSDKGPYDSRTNLNEAPIKIEVNELDWKAGVFPDNFPAEYADFVSYKPTQWITVGEEMSVADQERLNDILAYKEFYPHLAVMVIIEDIRYLPSDTWGFDFVLEKTKKFYESFPGIDRIDLKLRWSEIEQNGSDSFSAVLQSLRFYSSVHFAASSQLQEVPANDFPFLQLIDDGDFPHSDFNGHPLERPFFVSRNSGSFNKSMYGGVIWNSNWGYERNKIGYRTTDLPVTHGLRSFKENRDWINSELSIEQGPMQVPGITIDLSITGFTNVENNNDAYRSGHQNHPPLGTWQNEPYFSWDKINNIRTEANHTEKDELYGAHHIYSNSQQNGLWLEWIEESSIISRIEQVQTELLGEPNIITNDFRLTATTIKGLSGDVDDNYRRLKTVACALHYYNSEERPERQCGSNSNPVEEVNLGSSNSNTLITGPGPIKIIISDYPNWDFNSVIIQVEPKDNKAMTGQYRIGNETGPLNGWYQSISSVEYVGQDQFEITLDIPAGREYNLRWWPHTW
jgi:hypothetical protein